MATVTAVAAVVVQDGTHRVLIVRRPDEPADEFPGAWGLPAATVRQGETPAGAIERLGRDKLGLQLRASAELSRGTQARGDDVLEMILYEAKANGWPPVLQEAGAHGVTQYTDWAWSDAEALRPAAEQGSLCSRLYLGEAG